MHCHILVGAVALVVGLDDPVNRGKASMPASHGQSLLIDCHHDRWLLY